MDPPMNFLLRIVIKVHWEGEDFPLQIPVSATIMQLKLQISQLGIIAIPADRQELCLENGTGLSDEMTLEYYGISHATVLTVLQKIGVTIRKANNHFLGLIVNEHITVGTLKDYLRGQHGMDIVNKALEMEYEGSLLLLMIVPICGLLALRKAPLYLWSETETIEDLSIKNYYLYLE